MTDDLIDRLYEAAFVPEQWAGVLDGIAGLSGSQTGALLVYGEGGPPRFRSSARIEDLLECYCTTDAWQRSELTPYMVDLPPAAFFYDADYFPREVLERDFMRAPLRMRGLGHQLGALIPMPSGENVVVTFERALEAARPSGREMAFLDGLRPHFARSALMAARLGLERARATVATLAALGIPAAVLSRRGQVVAGNGLFEACERLFLPVAFGGLALADVDANRLFQEAIAAGRDAGKPPARSIPIRPAEDRAASVVHVLPLRRAAQDIFSGADMLVVLTEIASGEGVPDTRMLAALFDLSPAEARLAAALAAGRSLKEAASGMNVGFGSARTYLARIFSKTGVHQQSQLVALLKSVRAPVARAGRKDGR